MFAGVYMRFFSTLALACTWFLLAAVVESSTIAKPAYLLETTFSEKDTVLSVLSEFDSSLAVYNARLVYQISTISQLLQELIVKHQEDVRMFLQDPIVFNTKLAKSNFEKLKQELIDRFAQFKKYVYEVRSEITKHVYTNINSKVTSFCNVNLDNGLLSGSMIDFQLRFLQSTLSSLPFHVQISCRIFKALEMWFQQYLKDLLMAIQAVEVDFQEPNLSGIKSMERLQEETESAAGKLIGNANLAYRMLIQYTPMYTEAIASHVANTAMFIRLTNIAKDFNIELDDYIKSTPVDNLDEYIVQKE